MKWTDKVAAVARHILKLELVLTAIETKNIPELDQKLLSIAPCAWQLELDDIREYIRQLETNLAHADRLISAHAHLIDSNPRVRWPKGSILAAACDRHAARVAAERTLQASSQD